jgi:hypothetical protein
VRANIVSIATAVGFLFLTLAGHGDALPPRATTVRQIGPSVNATVNQEVEIVAGLTALPGDMIRFRTALAGMVHLFYKSGEDWTLVGLSPATGCYGSSDPYAAAKFRLRIPTKLQRGARLNLRFSFGGNPSFLPCTGDGFVFIE